LDPVESSTIEPATVLVCLLAPGIALLALRAQTCRFGHCETFEQLAVDDQQLFVGELKRRRTRRLRDESPSQPT
jgi:hypothetical protein